MIISGDHSEERKNVVEQEIDEALIRELVQEDAILAKKVQRRESVNQDDIDAAVKRIDEAKARAVLAKPDYSSWDLLENLKEHPLYHRRGRNRTQGAINIIKENVDLYSGFLIPGQIALFNYDDPETKEDLEWYDKTPCVIFFGYFKTKKGLIRELGFNLHYFPPFTRKNIMQRIFRLFKEHFLDNFDKPTQKEISGLTYKRLLASLRSSKLQVGVREYIPGLRKATRVIPTKYFPEAILTEGTFEGSTVRQIYQFWKNFRP